MKRINDNIAKEFVDLLNMKKKRTREQNARIREIWAAMRALKPGKYSTASVEYTVVARSKNKKRAATNAVFLKLISAAPVAKSKAS